MSEIVMTEYSGKVNGQTRTGIEASILGVAVAAEVVENSDE